ncbi:MAG: CvpA family protein [Pirellulaceae bacterium]|nr:CvpA family protein [Pirellulaceae bacterium]
MEIYDIIMLVIIVGAAFYGAIKGFAWQLASIASILVSYIVAFRFREPFSQAIQAEPPWNRFLAMLILFIGTSLVIWVAFRMISRSIDRMKLREFDRQVGFLFGGVKGFLYCTLITLFAVTLMGDTVRSRIVASKSGHFIAEVLDRSDSVIPEEIHVVIRPYLDRFDERFVESQDSTDSYSIPGADSGRETGSSGFLPWAAEQAKTAISQSGEVPDRLPDSFWNQNASEGQNQGVSQPWTPPGDRYQKAENSSPPSSFPSWQR